MRVWERWGLHGLSAALTGTGIAYFCMKYLMTSDDPFAVVNHPWQSAMLALHVVIAPAFLVLFGVVFNGHVMRKLRVPRGDNRRSGVASLATFVVMTASGYGLQVGAGEWVLQVLIAVHIASGVLFAAVYTAHLVVSLRLSRVWSVARDVA